MVAVFTLEEVSVRRGQALLLDSVGIEIRAGSCTALVGPSGAGKSTLLRLLNRLGEPTGGRVLLHGRPLPEFDVLALRRRVGLVAQAPTLLTERVLDDLRVGRQELTEDEAAKLLERVGLPDSMLERPTAGLSGGEAQRVCLARTLAVKPEVLLADESTSALDPASTAAVEAVFKQLAADGMTVVLVSHDAAQARRIADEAVVLTAGRLVEHGPVAQVAYLQGDAV
ncbi:putative ABC transport system ATP-binding protein [Kribbella sp. VKM Ac-2527]|uniref:Putative ABC transport system ATP-binding protein n=1 Tax=Kribbella caucasensis TaxID=2512215 RepID=A0A4R6KF80_9ACTN|nr:phosphate ABC transporter ATP-binding protein [Kribbella sp. VKM Ac-2527]TDO48470.1 putative ABC transport system ATP-binding protein [Kribbella sp. VKM Ac-2527]